MDGFDGVGRVYRTELNPQPERHPQTERVDKDRKGQGQQPQGDDEPHDTVELHEGDAGEPRARKPKPGKKPLPPKGGLDISA